MLTSIKQTMDVIYDIMTEEELTLLNDDDVNLIAQTVNADTGEALLEFKINEELREEMDRKGETL